jgi:hypothetical protein
MGNHVLLRASTDTDWVLSERVTAVSTVYL